MPIQKLTAYAGSVALTFATALNGLASGSTAKTTAKNNATDNYLFADLALIVSMASAPVSGTFLSVFLQASIDGTNYPDDALTLLGNPVGAAIVTNVTGAQACALIRGVQLPPGFYRYLIQSQTGVTLAGSGNSLTENYYNLQSI